MGIFIYAHTGTGKTTAGRKYANVIDLESTRYKYLGNNFSEQSKATEDRIPNPEWPDNYFRALAEVKDKYDYILISDDICNSWLWENNIKYWQICPDLSLRDEYCARFVARGNNPTFVSQQMQVWDEWIQTCSHDLRAEKIFILKSNEYVEDVINNKVKPTYIHK